MKIYRSIPIEILVDKIEKSDNEGLRQFIGETHYDEMYWKYIRDRNPDEALFHGELSVKFSKGLEANKCNNLGYLYLWAGDLNKSRELLEVAIGKSNSDEGKALANYNMGILEAKSGQYDKALKKINLCIEMTENMEKERRIEACLFVAEMMNAELVFRENRDRPDLLEVAKESKRILQGLENRSDS